MAHFNPYKHEHQLFKEGFMRIFLFSVLGTLCGLWAQPFEKLDPQNPIFLMKTTEGDIYIELFQKDTPQTVENFIGLATGTKTYRNPITLEKETKPFYDGLSFYRIRRGFFIQTGDPIGTGTADLGYTFEDEINATALGLNKLHVFDEKGQLHPHLREDSEYVQKILQQVLLPKWSQSFQIPATLKEEEKKKIFDEKVFPHFQSLTFKEFFEACGYQFKDSIPAHAPKRGYLAMANAGPNMNGSRFFINVVDNDWLAGRNTVFGRVIRGLEVADKIAEAEVDNNYKPKKDIRIVSITPVLEEHEKK